jgi:hypothetical protein
VARTNTGESIYESNEPIFFTEEQRDYYRDDVTIDAARAKLEWVARFVPPGSTLLDVGANFGHFLREAQRQYAAIGIEPSAEVVSWGRRHLDVCLEHMWAGSARSPCSMSSNTFRILAQPFSAAAGT